jgi:putative transposase
LNKMLSNRRAKVANRRKDFLHKASAKISQKFGPIVIGDVSPKKISQTTLAKSVGASHV